MHDYHELREMLCKELDEIARKKELSAGDLETVHKLTDTIKNLDKIEALGGGYSQARNWDWLVSYDQGNSYGNRGKHYVRGHYSRADAKDYMMGQLDDLMRSASTDRERDVIRRCMEQLELA